MMICDEHRLNDSRRNNEPCVYCQRDALKLQIDDLRESLRIKVATVDGLENGIEEAGWKLDEKDRLNGELVEAKGNLMDFIGHVRTWASCQPTGKSIEESCLLILERYAEKRIGGVCGPTAPAPVICAVQTNCHGGTCGNLLPCDVHSR